MGKAKEHRRRDRAAHVQTPLGFWLYRSKRQNATMFKPPLGSGYIEGISPASMRPR